MKELLVTYGPVGVPMYVNDSFSAYKSGVYSSCPDKATAEANLNHAVVVIGFDENGNYIIKNSWGTGWGMNGFGVVSKDPDCGISSAAYFYYSNAEAGGGQLYTNQVDLGNDTNNNPTTYERYLAWMMAMVLVFVAVLS